jgi:hypothetical protein
MKVLRNGEVNLLLQGNFKLLSMCDEFGEIPSKLHTRNWRFTTNETRNWLSKLIHIIDTHLFNIQLILIQSMVMLIWKESVWSSARRVSLTRSEHNGTGPPETFIFWRCSSAKLEGDLKPGSWRHANPANQNGPFRFTTNAKKTGMHSTKQT